MKPLVIASTIHLQRVLSRVRELVKKAGGAGSAVETCEFSATSYADPLGVLLVAAALIKFVSWD